MLRAALLASRVQVLTRCVALDALTGDGWLRSAGCWPGSAADDGACGQARVTARAVVLATGGFGQAYATTTNPAGLTGDGLALAARAGAAAAGRGVRAISPDGAVAARRPAASAR